MRVNAITALALIFLYPYTCMILLKYVTLPKIILQHQDDIYNSQSINS